MKKILIGFLCAIGIILCAGLVSYFFFPGVIVKTAITLARVSAGLSRHETQVDDHRWVYVEGGKGDVILFLHGYGDSKEGWGELPVKLKNRYRVIIPDLPGFGENSRILSDTYDIPNEVQWLDHFTTAIGIQSFHLVGMSLGGEIAAYYAGVHPEKVKSLMIMGASGIRLPTPSEPFLAYQQGKPESLYYKSEKGFHQLLHWAFDNPPQFPKLFIEYFVATAKARYDFNKKLADELFKDGYALLENRLDKIKAPTLIIWGRNDRIIPVATSETFKRGIPNNRLEVLDGGHNIYFDQPEKTFSLYSEFLKNVK